MSANDKLLTSVPVNSVAARVTSKGVHRPEYRGGNDELFSECPVTDRFFGPTHQNLSGRRFGRLVVVGKAEHKKGKQGRWVVRCDCGFYCYKQTKTLTTGVSRHARMCRECAWLEYLKSGSANDRP